ncbi:MAG: hypothetical protein K5979_09445 [Ruminococcus sp.]|nr:hypothetical protein [Ruminococcus sp.]
MKYIKKLFGGIDLTWKKLLIFSVAAGIIPGILLVIPAIEDTSFTDNGSSYEWWIFFAIIIISNCKKPLEASCKTFVFFLISQPLIYLVQVPFCWLHWGIFTYYPPWFIQTLLTFPGAFLGWYAKKDKWYSLLILSPMLFLLAFTGMSYLHGTLAEPPRHILTVIFCAVQMFVLLFGLFENKKLIIAGCIISAGMLTAGFFMNCWHKPHYISNIYGYEINPDMHYTGESSNEDIVKVAPCEYGDPNELQAEFYKKGSATITLTGDDGSVIVYKATLSDDSKISFDLVKKTEAENN